MVANGTVIASSRNPWPSKTPETGKIDYQSPATSLSRDVTPDGKGLLISRPREKRESNCARDVFLAPSKVELLNLRIWWVYRHMWIYLRWKPLTTKQLSPGSTLPSHKNAQSTISVGADM